MKEQMREENTADMNKKQSNELKNQHKDKKRLR